MPRLKPKTPQYDSASVAVVNQLVGDLRMATRHDEMSRFDLTIEYVQGAGSMFFWRAYVKQNGHISATSKMQHTTPGGAVKELWIHLVGRD